MIKGYNKYDLAEGITQILAAALSEEVRNRPCVFISHKYEDKQACREIAKYLSEAGIDYYLDEKDEGLQHAVETGNVNAITESIKKGIRESTHMLVVVSGKTYQSHWVPFEVGYGHSAIIDDASQNGEKNIKIKLSILTLKDISEIELPTFMQVGNILKGTKSLNHYISSISDTEIESMINESRLFSHSKGSHPLDNTLNWKL